MVEAAGIEPGSKKRKSSKQKKSSDWELVPQSSRGTRHIIRAMCRPSHRGVMGADLDALYE